MELHEIKLGDEVELRNGERIVVWSKCTSYSDRTGTHEGPFVSPQAFGERYLLADVARVTKRNERLCRFCGEGVTATVAETDFCRLCFYSGRSLEDSYSGIIGRLTSDETVESADVWHTGGGCFLLAVTRTDGRLLTCAADQDAVLPAPGEKWWAFEYPTESDFDRECEGYEVNVTHHEHLSDDDLVAVATKKGG